MKAIVHERYGLEAVELREVEKPLVGEDQVLVRVYASSVNPVEWYSVYAPPFVRVISRQLRRPPSSRRRLSVSRGLLRASGRALDRG